MAKIQTEDVTARDFRLSKLNKLSVPTISLNKAKLLRHYMVDANMIIL